MDLVALFGTGNGKVFVWAWILYFGTYVEMCVGWNLVLYI
jgi:hypothetical protein